MQSIDKALANLISSGYSDMEWVVAAGLRRQNVRKYYNYATPEVAKKVMRNLYAWLRHKPEIAPFISLSLNSNKTTLEVRIRETEERRGRKRRD